jgi:hypothetical protein
MADPAPLGSDVSAGTHQCTNCQGDVERDELRRRRLHRLARLLAAARRTGS